MLDPIETAVAAHARMLQERQRRDTAIRRALAHGASAYSIAKAIRTEVGEAALTTEGVRKIGLRLEADENVDAPAAKIPVAR